jgi:hypothetical protein
LTAAFRRPGRHNRPATRKEQSFLRSRGSRQEVHPLQVSVTEDTIVHRIYDGTKWVTLDELKLPATENVVGKFGFFLPGKDRIFLSHFSFKLL